MKKWKKLQDDLHIYTLIYDRTLLISEAIAKKNVLVMPHAPEPG
jgi:hypothetical protein